MRSMSARIALAMLGLAIAATACAGKASPGSGGRTITIVAPQQGATVQSPVHLTLSVTGAEIGPVDTGKMHFHVHVDGSNQYTIAYSTDATVPVPAGKHTLEVVLAEPNHSETSTTATVTVQVSGGGGGSPSPSSSAKGGYGY